MRELKTLAVGLVAVVSTAGCALQQRQWGSCAIAGAVIGGAVGGIAGGVTTNNTQEHASDGERGAAIGGGIAGGAALGALLGHAICDPMKPAPTPAVAAAPPPPPPAPPAKGTKLATVGEAFFDFDKATIKAADGQEVLGQVVKTMQDTPSLKVVVHGYTDSIGSEAYNLKLSQRRARAVRDYLVQHGIEASRIATEGHGKANPVASNETASGRAKNRRAEVVAD